jgi:hypothetical protein
MDRVIASISCDGIIGAAIDPPPPLGELDIVSSCQNAVCRVCSEIPRGQQNRYIRTLRGPRRCKQQQHLVLAFEERLDLADEELMVRCGLEAFMTGPLG